MPDIREVLKGLDAEDRAVYAETRNVMSRAYLAVHSRVLPIDKFNIEDDQFLDLIDIQVALLFERSGRFDHSQGSIDTDKAKEATDAVESEVTRMLRNGSNGAASQGWGQQK